MDKAFKMEAYLSKMADEPAVLGLEEDSYSFLYEVIVRTVTAATKAEFFELHSDESDGSLI